MTNAKLTFSVEAGLLVRGQIKSFVEGICMQNDIECEVIESKSLLESIYFFKIKGDYDKILRVKNYIEETVKLNQED